MWPAGPTSIRSLLLNDVGICMPDAVPWSCSGAMDACCTTQGYLLAVSLFLQHVKLHHVPSVNIPTMCAP